MKYSVSGFAQVISLAFLLAMPTWSGTMVVNFDDIMGVPAFGNPVNVRATFVGLGIDTTYSGFNWPSASSTQFWGVVNNADFAFQTVRAFSGPQAGWNWGGALDQEILFPSPYTVEGAYFNAFQASQAFTADTVQFIGFDAAGKFVASSQVLHLDKVSASPAWQWLSFGASGIRRLDILATQTSTETPGLGIWAIDNLTVSADVASVPEPATISYTLVVTLMFIVLNLGRLCDLFRET
jgi:hypothetical protein